MFERFFMPKLLICVGTVDVRGHFVDKRFLLSQGICTLSTDRLWHFLE
jgi:hypothetical protein